MGSDTSQLEVALGHVFRSPALLERALTHSSAANERQGNERPGNERPGQSDNEALEFLGDALFGFLIAEALLERFPDMDEGGLSKCKAFLVSRRGLAQVARQLDLGAYLKIGKALEKGEGRARDSLLADALEAVLAAVHLDAGETAARAVVRRLFAGRVAALDRQDVERKDYKTVLQEELQARGRPTPVYKVGAVQGPPHKPTFHVEVIVDDAVVARAQGGSKKEAEQKAARLALKVIRPAETAARRA